jgi:glycosyltransferase involved in cell wall biosynthesis
VPHLAILTSSFPEHYDGSEAAGSFVAQIADTLAESGSVSVIAPSGQSAVVQQGALEVVRFRSTKLPLSRLNPANPLDWIPIAQVMKGGMRELSELHSRRPVDAILALWALPSGYWARALRRQHGIPYGVWALGSDIWALKRIPVVRGLLSSILRDASVRYADGLGLCTDVSALCAQPCGFLPSSRKLPRVEQQASGDVRAGYRLAYLGRFHPNKGTDLLMQALELLSEEDWAHIACVRIAGGGSLHGTVAASAQRLRADGRPVQVEGYKNAEEAASLLTWADFVLIPSRIESIPVIFSDAMQLGKPVITMPVGDLPELITHYGVGVTCAEVTAQSYANLLRAGKLEGLSGKLNNCAGAYEQFRVERVASQIMADLLGGHV